MIRRPIVRPLHTVCEVFLLELLEEKVSGAEVVGVSEGIFWGIVAQSL